MKCVIARRFKVSMSALAVLAFSSTALLINTAGIQAKVRPYSKTRTLQNGIKLAIVERSEQPIISFHIRIRAGSKFDPTNKAGLASVTAQLLRQGAGSRDAKQFQRQIDSLGIRLQIEVTRDAVEIAATVSRKELLACTWLLRDLLMEQTFDSESLTRQIQRSLSAVQQSADVGYNILSDFAYQQFYTNKTYAASPLGNANDLKTITLNDVKDYYKKFYAPDRISIVAAGDISAKDYITEIHQILSSYPKNKHRESDKSEEIAIRETDALEIYLLDFPSSTGAKIGFFALCDSAADVRAFGSELMLSHLLAGFPELSFLGRKLATEDIVSNLRAELPFSSNQTLMEIQMDCTSDRVVDAVSATISSLQMLRETRVSKRELEEGKNYFSGFYALGFETAQDVTKRFSELMRANLTFKGHDTLLTEINSLTQSDLKVTSQKIFAPKRLIVVIRGDAVQYAEGLKAYGTVEIISNANTDH